MTNRRKFLKYVGIGAIASLLFMNTGFASNSDSQLSKVLESVRAMNVNKVQIGELVTKIGKSFVGKPYIGGTLDTQDTESLIYSLDGFDCVTFCETTLALARIAKQNHYTTKDFESELTKIRYKGGRILGYASRNHYSSEWIISNVELGILKDLSKDLKGRVFSSQVYFMSRNANLYKALKEDPAMTGEIAKNESKVNSTERYYIAKADIPKILSKINSGDIIIIATSKPGLDYSHLGIAYRNSNGKLCLMHASSNKKEVILDSELLDYLDKSKSTIGISVLRPL